MQQEFRSSVCVLGLCLVGRDKNLWPRALGLCQDQQGCGENDGGEKDGEDEVGRGRGGEVWPSTGTYLPETQVTSTCHLTPSCDLKQGT